MGKSDINHFTVGSTESVGTTVSVRRLLFSTISNLLRLLISTISNLLLMLEICGGAGVLARIGYNKAAARDLTPKQILVHHANRQGAFV